MSDARPSNESPQTVDVALTRDERDPLSQGLWQWQAPARPNDDVGRVIGFADTEDLYVEGTRIAAQLDAGEPLSEVALRHALVATEIVFASHYYGAGDDREIVTGLDDQHSLEPLRAIQGKVPGLRSPPEAPPARRGE